MARANQDSQLGSLSGNNPGGGLDLTLGIGLPNNDNPDGRVDTELRIGQPHKDNHLRPKPNISHCSMAHDFSSHGYHPYQALVNFNENSNRGDAGYRTEIGNPSGSGARRCIECFTTNTPQWRKGHAGQDLCNACGLREKRKEKKIWPGH